MMTSLWEREYMNVPLEIGGRIKWGFDTIQFPRVVNVPTVWLPDEPHIHPLLEDKVKYWITYPSGRVVRVMYDGTREEYPIKGDKSMVLSEDFVRTMASNLAHTMKHYRDAVEEDMRNIIDLELELEKAREDSDKHIMRQGEIMEAADELMKITRNNFRNLLDCDDVKLLAKAMGDKTWESMI
jgi:hypothetical protein